MNTDPLVNVLLVDDKPANLAALEATLAGLGLNLVKANSGPEALRALLEQEVALVLTDVTMPGMDGFELATAIYQREQTQAVPVIFITATDPEREKVARGYGAGAVDYLIKPFDPEILRGKVRTFVRLHQQAKAVEAQAARLAAAIAQLNSEVAQRQAAEATLQHALADVEAQVRSRTAALTAESDRVRNLLAQARQGRRALANVLEDQQQAAAALRESEERFRRVFEEGPLGMILARPGDGRFLRANAAFCQMLGYTEEELQRRTFVEVTHPEHREADLAAVRKLWAGQLSQYKTEKRYLKKTGEALWATLTAALVQGADGRPLYSLAMIEDITARKEAEAALRQSREDLRTLWARLDAAREEEARRIARELHDSTGQKLASLAMTLGLLQDAVGVLVGPAEKLFAACLTTVQQCAQEVRTQSYLLHPPLLDQMGLTVAISDYGAGFSKRSGVRLTIEVPSEFERLPEAVELALFRVLQESLGNVHRHAGVDTANVRLTSDAEAVTLEVSDQGRGIAPETLRGFAARRGLPGVGLAGMRERLQLLGGRLEIESSERGTTIRAIVPQGGASEGGRMKDEG
jgi:PAS domain S-box-containing protein